MSCAVCGAGPGRPKLCKGSVEILACPDCGLEWWQPPEDFRAEDTYDAAYFDDAGASHGYSDYAGMEHAFRTSFARRLARLPAAAAGERLLDVGAAYGYAVLEAQSRGWQAFGLELAPAAAREASRLTGGRVVAASGLATPFASASFDVVTLWDVLEHLPEPHAAVAEIARVLRPGGRLVLSTGDVGSLVARASGRRWHLYTLPEHLYFYTRRSLEHLLGVHGFRVEAARADSSFYTLGYLVERLRKSLLGHAGARGEWPGSRVCLPVNLFDIVTVTARRIDEPEARIPGVPGAARA